MSLATVYSRAQTGMDAALVCVEVQLTRGLPGMSIVGLPEAALREAKDRVRGALMQAGFAFPKQRVIVNLAPADLPKEGGRFDLAIAMGILCASEQIKKDAADQFEFLGELSLSGLVRPVRGVLPAALAADKDGRTLIAPHQNAEEAALAEPAKVLLAPDIGSVAAQLSRADALTPALRRTEVEDPDVPDIADVIGHERAKRALEIAAAGGHHLLMTGPPGTGKSMLAARFPGILPPMAQEEAVQSAAVLSLHQGQAPLKSWRQRPFRQPHHSSSAAALVGGGARTVRPGEISLAHNGVLFLDELPEFQRNVLEVLREPLENGCVAISRAHDKVEFPARFQLIAAMNPCPCGYFADPDAACHCSEEQVQRYRNRLSGPLLDRIDIHVDVPRVRRQTLIALRHQKRESSLSVRARVCAARERQLDRQGAVNQRLRGGPLQDACALTRADELFLANAADELNLSMRSYDKVLRIARSIADLASEDKISTVHLTEALSYRHLHTARTR